jgi:MFS family permease
MTDPARAPARRWSLFYSQFLQTYNRDVHLLFTTRMLRLFAYGFMSVILVLYLRELEIGEVQIGLLLTLTLLGDTVIALWITISADRLGRRRMLVISSLLVVAAGVVFSITNNFWLLLAAATIGVISPSGYEVGPFLAIEQSSLAQTLPDRLRTQAFAWYNLMGSVATAFGALFGGVLVQALQGSGAMPLASYRIIVLIYSVNGLLLVVFFALLSRAIEVDVNAQGNLARLKTRFGLHRSQKVVFRLSSLFALDAFAGGFIIQSLLVYWFHVRFGAEPAVLGSIFFVANLISGLSALLAVRLARRFGLINTMVFTHIPSNILLILVPFMPNLWLAAGLLLVRYSISQMDVPTRQSYIMSVVDPDERSAAAGITGVARTTGAALAPVFTGIFMTNPLLLASPFVISGVLKIIYDLMLYRNFRSIKPPEELTT